MLIVHEILKLPDGNLALSANFYKENEAREYSLLSIDETKKKISESNYWFNSNEKRVELEILETDVSSSLSNVKSVYLKVSKNEHTLNLNVHEIIHVD